MAYEWQTLGRNKNEHHLFYCQSAIIGHKVNVQSSDGSTIVLAVLAIVEKLHANRPNV